MVTFQKLIVLNPMAQAIKSIATVPLRPHGYCPRFCGAGTTLFPSDRGGTWLGGLVYFKSHATAFCGETYSHGAMYADYRQSREQEGGCVVNCRTKKQTSLTGR